LASHNKKSLPEIAKSGMIVGKLHIKLAGVLQQVKTWE
jgi:hypothetical protein